MWTASRHLRHDEVDLEDMKAEWEVQGKHRKQ